MTGFPLAKGRRLNFDPGKVVPPPMNPSHFPLPTPKGENGLPIYPSPELNISKLASRQRLLLGGILFIALFLFRLFFGLCECKWWEVDERQTWLIGLKYYATAEWPYFGPDVNGQENQAFNAQLPGAVEGLAFGLPWRLFPFPETPVVVLALLTTLGASLLAWYIRRKIPSLSWSWLFAWISVTPWGLFEGTHVITLPYNFLPSIFFFLGFFECFPSFSTRWLSPRWAGAFMGFSLFWIMQFHFSYVYLVPLAGLSLLMRIFHDKNGKAAMGFILGALPTLLLVIPTWVKYGLNPGHVTTGFMVSFNLNNFTEGLTLLARYLSLVCFELLRFIGQGTHERWGFLTSHPLLFIPGVILSVGGIAQTIILASGVFRKKHFLQDWEAMKGLMVGCYFMIWASFWFTSKQPLPHIYFVFYPMLMVYSCYVWVLFSQKKFFVIAARVFVVLGFFFMGFYSPILAQKDGLYLNREPLAQALKQKNYHLAGERRPRTLY